MTTCQQFLNRACQIGREKISGAINQEVFRKNLGKVTKCSGPKVVPQDFSKRRTTAS
jgi:hypothetical protein